MDLNQIREHWEKAGETISLSSKVTLTSRDPYLGELERNNISKFLNRNQTVLEIGCGDAFHALEYANKVKYIIGMDVANSLILNAKKRFEKENINNAEFITGSVLDLDKIINKVENKFDCIITQRCLINLAEWKHQKEAILQIHSLLQPNGLFLMTEGFQDEIETLNKIREKSNLESIQVVDYNRNFIHSEFDEFVKQYFYIEKIYDYGLYFFLSRIYHPLVVAPENPKHDSRFNEMAMFLSSFTTEGIFKEPSYNLFYVLKKK